MIRYPYPLSPSPTTDKYTQPTEGCNAARILRYWEKHGVPQSFRDAVERSGFKPKSFADRKKTDEAHQRRKIYRRLFRKAGRDSEFESFALLPPAASPPIPPSSSAAPLPPPQEARDNPCPSSPPPPPPSSSSRVVVSTRPPLLPLPPLRPPPHLPLPRPPLSHILQSNTTANLPPPPLINPATNLPPPPPHHRSRPPLSQLLRSFTASPSRTTAEPTPPSTEVKSKITNINFYGKQTPLHLPSKSTSDSSLFPSSLQSDNLPPVESIDLTTEHPADVADVTVAPAEGQPRARPSEAAILDFSQDTGNIVSGYIHNGNADHYLKRAICTLEAAVMEQENSVRGMKRRLEEMKRERDRVKRRNWQNNSLI